jgi:RNA polymerase sigma factor (sigma-70 family)
VTTTDFYAILKVQNGRIRKAMQEAGITNAARLAEKAGRSAGSVGDLLNFKISPRRIKDGKWRKVTMDVCDALMVDPSDMFPDHLVATMDSNQIAGFVERGQIPFADKRRLPSPVEAAVAQELKDKIERVLQTLTFREREIVKLRYALEGGHSYTLEEVARIFDINRERVRQIEAKGIRKLQHPARAKHLEAFVEQRP